MRLHLLPLLLLSTSLAARAGDVPKVAFEKYTLPNGLQVILTVDKKLPIVHVNQWFHVGSKNEKPGHTGFAHLFEHMMFQGSKHASEKYLTYAEKLGASLRDGGVNGTTDIDRTNYFITAPSGGLETMLWLESDRLTGLLDALTKEKLDNQRDVVKNERRQSYENVPYGRWSLLVYENIFPQGHPYSWPTIGSMADLTAASMEDVKDFFRTYYTPNNLTLTVAGDFEPAEAKKLIEKYFAPVPAGPALERPVRLPVTLTGEKLVRVSDRVPQARSYLAWPAAAFFDAGDAELDLADLVLTNGLSSRLQRLLVYEKQLCTSVQSMNMSMEIAGVFGIVATARPGAKLEEIEKLVDEAVHELATKGPSETELNRAKTHHEFEFVTDLERIGGFGGKSDQLARYNTFLGNPDMFEPDMARYRAATTESVRQAVAKFLDNRNRLVLRFTPEVSGRAAAETVNRALEPKPGPDRPFSVPAVETATLANGLRIFVVEKHELPKVAVSTVIKAGNVVEPADRAPAETLLMRVLDRGTASRTAMQIDEEFADLGTHLAKSVNREQTVVSFESLSRHLEKCLALTAQVMLHPALPDDEIERERKKLGDDLLQERETPNRIARRLEPILMFGVEHPYGHPVLGDAAKLQALKKSDLEDLYKKIFVPSNSAVIFAGDVTLAQAKALCEKELGSWKGEPSQPLAIPLPKPSDAGKIYLVDRQDAAQTVVSMLLPGIARDSKDYYGLKIVDAVFGGGFGTRLNLNLREKKGYSYGIFSFLWTGRSLGCWTATGSVQTKVTSESVSEFFSELQGMAGARPITRKELEEAKANRVRSYAQSFETLPKLTGKVAELFVLDRPLSELASEPSELEKVTLETANELSKKYALPASARLLVVGDASKIAKGLAERKLGDIVRLDPLGNPIKE